MMKNELKFSLVKSLDFSQEKPLISVFWGECLASNFQPARYVFRDSSGNIWCRVNQNSSFSLLDFTKFRMLKNLELFFDAIGLGKTYTLQRKGGWKELVLLLGSDLHPLWIFAQSSFFGTTWTITDNHTSLVALGKVVNPFILGPQRLKIEGKDGSLISIMTWRKYSFRLGTFSRVEIEMFNEGWALPSIAFSVLRWLYLQQR